MPIPIAALALLPAGLLAVAPAQRIKRRQDVRRLKQAAIAVDAAPGSSPRPGPTAEPGAWERALHRSIQTRLDPLLGRARERQLRELSGRSDQLVLGERERAINLRLAFSTLLLAASIVTLPLPFWVRTLTCLPMAVYLVREEFDLALRTLIRQRRL